jgi:hypothetical protein
MNVVMNVVEYDSSDKFDKSQYEFHKNFVEILFYFLIHPLPWIN